MLSYVPGESLTRLTRKSFWADAEQVTVLARQAGGTLRALNEITARPVRQAVDINAALQKTADTFRGLFRLNMDEEHALSELVRTVNETSRAISHEVLIQGDFWHGNMIRDKKRRNLIFVDWQFARWSVDVSMDVYFFLLAGALSATEKGTAERRAKEAFGLLKEWQKDIIPEYLFAYGVPEHYILLPQKYGMMLCCVEKAVRSALEFGYSHPDDLVWRYLFVELMNWPSEN
jgi:hypothetical protein